LDKEEEEVEVVIDKEETDLSEIDLKDKVVIDHKDKEVDLEEVLKEMNGNQQPN
jgi:uncharacterized membrane protein YjjP (DUF1212 family)